MPRFALKIEYDGAPFAGWQRQADRPSVQGAIEAALAKLEPADHKIAAAGRTDKGVHAQGQVAHCDLKKDWDPFRLSEAINFHLKPTPVAVVDCAAVDEDFHARFSASARHYIFRIMARRAPLTFGRGLFWQVKYNLDLAALQAGASMLLGTHDFTTFRSTMCQAASPVKTLDRLDVSKITHPEGIEYRFDVRAKSFLHNQVRSFVGSLERVGVGAWTPDDMARALEAKDRAACGPVCPPQGLYLAHVVYPNDPFAK
ncbi:tRNA pseudouridine(38-40) synthase TruA [Yoonia sp.]|uniref:tRNA pseudouridine(38-40) synthase TruA n=1 Tax=Yoonia sp. TaxID=2212373 RepID=UPI002389FF5E|nr:tRNA pseudouridine(38-40) synthase TruA [Yoonia sp.]MDE0850212.1 tRNA pseudouridine(38-40) synthase TruA [Yoonia sp.]